MKRMNLWRMMSPRLQMMTWLMMMNLISFLLMAWDKVSAMRGWRRVAERTLVAPVVVGGVAGVVVAMLLLSHKSSKRSFQGKVAVAAALHYSLTSWRLS